MFVLASYKNNLTMFRKCLFYLFVFLIYNVGQSQNQYEYAGAIVLNDSSSTTYSYMVSLSEVSGAVSGYSITNIGTEYETKTTVLGNYNKQKKELTIGEGEIIYTKTPIHFDEESCFVNFSIKSFAFGKTKNAKGKFKGLSSDFKKCAEGEIFLNSIEKVEARISKVVKKIYKSKRIADSVKQKINPLKMLDSLRMNILRKNQTLSVFSKSEKVDLIIYDGGKVDGDKITISVNGKVLVNQYNANNTKKIISIDLVGAKTSIVIKANNEGLIAPNTIVVELDDRRNHIKALSNLKSGESTKIDILKKK